MKNRSFIMSTILVSGVNIIARFLGFLYRMVLVRFIGSAGMGLIELITPVFLLFYTLTGTGTQISVMQMVAANKVKDRKISGYDVTKIILKIIFFFSLIIAVIYLIVVPYINEFIFQNKLIDISLYLFGPVIVIMACSAILRGYFYGSKNVLPCAISQLTEEIIKISVVFMILFLFYPFDIYTSVTINIIGLSISELVGLLLLYLIFLKNKPNTIKSPKYKFGYKDILPYFIRSSLPITLSRLVSAFMRMINTIILPSRLMIAGLSHEVALGYIGQINGMVFPLMFMPFTLTSALCINIMPRITAVWEKKDMKKLDYYISRVMHISFLIAIPCFLFFYYFSDQLFYILYKVENGFFLRVLAFNVITLLLLQISTSILHGMKQQNISTIHFLLGSILQFIMIYILTANPSFNINGYTLSILITTTLICILNIFAVYRYNDGNIHIIKWIVIPLIISLISIWIGQIVYRLLINYEIFSLLAACFIMFVVYLSLLVFSGNIKDIKLVKKD